MYRLHAWMLFVISIVSPSVAGISPPHNIVYSDREIAFNEGESFTLLCRADGDPEPEYSWLKDGSGYYWQGSDGRIFKKPREGSLVFVNPVGTDEGIYQCFVRNALGEAVSDLIHVKKAYLDPFEASDTKYFGPFLGHPLTLQCDPPASYPVPQIFWAIKEANQVLTPVTLSDRVTMDHEGNLQFTNVLSEDGMAGQSYVCIVQNQVLRGLQQGGNQVIEPTGSSIAMLPVGFLWNSPSNIVALRGEEVKMKCIFSGSPTPRVQWSDVAIEQHDRVRWESYGQELVIENVQESDAGVYECLAINDESLVPLRRTVTLVVEAAPYWVSVPVSVKAGVGEDVSLHCEAIGIPEPSPPQWFINGHPIDTDSTNDNIEIGDESLTLKNVTLDDTSVLQCNVSNSHGYLFHNVYISVQMEPAKIEDPLPDGLKIVEGKDFIFRCKNTGSPSPHVWWQKEDINITDGRFFVTESGDLFISNVSKEDTGNYTCFAVNKHGEAKSTGSLIVRSPTRITRGPDSATVEEYQDVQFFCTATTDPEETEHLVISWLYRDKPLPGNNLRFIQDPRDMSLHVVSVITIDRGNYTCMASNGLDSDTATAELIVKAPPNPPDIISVECNYQELTATIKWRSYDYPNTDFHIVQHNISSDPYRWVEIERLNYRYAGSTKVDLSPWYKYAFRVLAGNSVGLSDYSWPSRQVCSTPPDLPYSNPQNVVAEGNQPDNLIIYWTPLTEIEYNGPGLKYVIRYNEESVVVYDPASWFHVIQLPSADPYQEFSVSVRSVNNLGECQVPAVTVVGHSGEDIPEVAPSDVRVDADSVTDTEVTVQWIHVDTSPQAINGYFRGYRIQYGRLSEWPELVKEEDYIMNKEDRHYLSHRLARQTPPTDILYHLKHDMPYSAIRLQVRVLNKFYAGPASDVVLFNSLEGVPGPPKSLIVIGQGSDYLELLWEPPVYPNGILISYIISYRTVSGLNLGTSLPDIEVGAHSVTTLNLTNLQPATQYRVYVRAKTLAGPGEPNFLQWRTSAANMEDEDRKQNVSADCECSDAEQSDQSECNCHQSPRAMNQVMEITVTLPPGCENSDASDVSACQNSATLLHSISTNLKVVAVIISWMLVLLLGH